MPEPSAVNDLAGAVSDALRGDRTTPPRPRGGREIELRLSNGRRVRARIEPAVARRADLAGLARTMTANQRRTSEGLRDLDRRITALDRKTDLAMIGLLRGLGTRREQLQQVQQAMNLLPARAPIQAATSVVNTVQAVAYGDKGSVFTTNNLLLAGTQLFWNLLEPVLLSTGVLNAQSALIVAALAPFGTLVTGGALLGERQHERFLTGVLTVTGSDLATQSLRAQVGEALWPSFRDRTDVPVTVVVIDPPGFSGAEIVARVNAGTVEVFMLPIVSQDEGPVTPPTITVRVVWTVDSGAIGG